MSTLGPQPTRPRRFATLASVALLHHTGTGTSVTLLGIINDSLSSPVAPAADMCLPGSDFPHVDGNTTLKLQLTTRTIVPAEHGPTHGIMMWWWHRSTRHRPSSASSGTSLLGELSLNTRNPGNTIR